MSGKKKEKKKKKKKKNGMGSMIQRNVKKKTSMFFLWKRLKSQIRTVPI